METDGEADSEGQAGGSCVVQGAAENISGANLQLPAEPEKDQGAAGPQGMPIKNWVNVMNKGCTRSAAKVITKTAAALSVTV